MSTSNLGTNPPTGMRDFLPEAAALRDYATAIILKTYLEYGFSRIETSVLEDVRRLTGGDGGENEGLIFKILKRGEKLNLTQPDLKESDIVDLGLRYDLTVPLVRFYANNQAKVANPFKAIQIGSVWRADRPQKGRYRQFTQCDIDMFGVAHETAEIELISATAEALCRLGFRNFSVRLNDRRILANIVTKAGFPQDRIDEVFITIDKLDKIGVAGVRTELESREVEGRRFEKAAVDAIVDFLERVEALSPAERSSLIDEACAGLSDEVTAGLRNIMRVTNSLAKGRYEVVFDPTLVRGMGYYTGPIFELYSKDFGASLGGGGRYDKLVGKFLGKDVPACGFSIGFERILLLIEEQKLLQSTREGKRALFFEYGKDDIEAVFQTAQRERETGGPISVFEKPRKLSNRLTDLVRDGYRFFAVYQTNTPVEFKPIAIDAGIE